MTHIPALKLLAIVLIINPFYLLYSQARKGRNNKVPSIAPEFEKGWYLPYKGDTIKGEIQTNAGETEAAFNTSFFFRTPNSKRVTEINSKKAKAYGFADRQFELLKIKETEYFAEILERGRIILYRIYQERKDKDKKVAVPIYYVVDTQADPKSKLASLVELPKEKPYKKVLKELFKEQPTLIENVDKWYLQIEQVRQAIHEFNQLYQNASSPTAPNNPKKEETEQIEVERIK